jgi:hypothetical protein
LVVDHILGQFGIGLVTVKRSGKWSYYKRNEKTITAVVARLKTEL